MSDFTVLNDGKAGTLIEVLPNKMPMPNMALLGSYMASSLVPAGNGLGATPISETAQASAQPLLAQPHA